MITKTEHDGLIQGIYQLTLLGLFSIHDGSVIPINDWDYTACHTTIDGARLLHYITPFLFFKGFV